MGLIDRNQGPWWDWKKLWASETWQRYCNDIQLKTEQTGMRQIPDLNGGTGLTNMQKLNLIQVDLFYKSLKGSTKNHLI